MLSRWLSDLRAPSILLIIAEEPMSDSLENLSDKALNKLLDDVLENEDYERAAKIRDEIKKRSEGGKGT